MSEEVRALLLHSHEVPVAALMRALDDQFICTERACSYTEAFEKLAGSNPPHLVFTDTDLPDGTWSDVVDLAARATRPVSVIVVSPVADIPLYIDVMERRAFDFITHSFTAPELTHILRCAVRDILRQRKEQVQLSGGGAKSATRSDTSPLKKS